MVPRQRVISGIGSSTVSPAWAPRLIDKGLPAGPGHGVAAIRWPQARSARSLQIEPGSAAWGRARTAGHVANAPIRQWITTRDGFPRSCRGRRRLAIPGGISDQRVFLDRPDISTCTRVRTILEGAVIKMRVVPPSSGVRASMTTVSGSSVASLGTSTSPGGARCRGAREEDPANRPGAF